MKRKLFGYATLSLLLLSTLEGCAVLNTLVSLKYETGPPVSASSCISSVTGANLCAALHWHKQVAAGSLVSFFVLLIVAALLNKRNKQREA